MVILLVGALWVLLSLFAVSLAVAAAAGDRHFIAPEPEAPSAPDVPGWVVTVDEPVRAAPPAPRSPQLN